MRRSESVVVCDLSSVVVAFMTSRGFGRFVAVVEASGCVDDAVESFEGAREDWKCVRRSWVVFVRSMRERRSAACFVESDFGGMATQVNKVVIIKWNVYKCSK